MKESWDTGTRGRQTAENEREQNVSAYRRVGVAWTWSPGTNPDLSPMSSCRSEPIVLVVVIVLDP
jgi:hypothetical protein